MFAVNQSIIYTMETTRKKYIEQKHTELFDSLGCFFAFNNEQLKEGIEKAGGIEVTGKYVAVGNGLLCPKKNVDALIEGMDNVKKQWLIDRKQVEQVKLKFMRCSGWGI